jgi:hypothetical protein
MPKCVKIRVTDHNNFRIRWNRWGANLGADLKKALALMQLRFLITRWSASKRLCWTKLHDRRHQIAAAGAANRAILIR